MEQKPFGGAFEVTPLNGHEHGHHRTSRRISGRYHDILVCFLAMTVPMVSFSALLLGLIYRFRIVRTEFKNDHLRFTRGEDGSGAMFVDLSATTLTTIASWSSTIAPVLVGFALTLMSYPVSRTLLNAANENRPEQLPTPYQAGLMIRMAASGGPVSLWHWLKYAAAWKGRRQSQPGVLKQMTSILFLGILLSILVFITDTWLHFTTKTVTFTQLFGTTNVTSGYVLSESCISVETPFSGGCTLNTSAAVVYTLGGSTTLQVLNNISETTMVKTLESNNTSFAYLGKPPQALSPSIDYTAKSWAVKTQCAPVTRKCMDPGDFFGAGTPFNCPFAFEGDLNQKSWNMAYFTDATGSDNATHSQPISNPYYFSIAAAANQQVGLLNPILEKDPEVAFATHGAMVFALFCNATVYDLEYTLVNNTMKRFVTKISNFSMANIVQGTQQYSDTAGNQALSNAAFLAAFSNSSLEIADKVAVAYSRVALSVAANAFVPAPAIDSQLRKDMLVTRVPKAPLAALLLANLVLAGLGFGLTFVALIAARGEAGEVQARWSITGLVADRFEGLRAKEDAESVDALFEEYNGERGPKVGIIRNEEGGWSYGVWKPA